MNAGTPFNAILKGTSWKRRLVADSRGAIFVEFLIAFLPVYVFFLCVIQLGLLFSARMIVEHAAVNAARAFAVVGGDDPKDYNGEKKNKILRDGERKKTVRKAVILTLAPLIMNGVVQRVRVQFPKADEPDGTPQEDTFEVPPMGPKSINKVRVRVEADTACRLALAGPIVCRSFLGFIVPGGNKIFLPTVSVRAEAIFPYQGANYDYP